MCQESDILEAENNILREQVRILREVANQILLEEDHNPGGIPGDIVDGARSAFEATKD